MIKFIRVKTNFVGFHRWKDAPDKVKFLRSFHRHIFYVDIILEVEYSNRDLEFFITKEKLDKFIEKHYSNKQFEKSCEQIAEEISNEFDAIKVEVSEDGENSGGIINK